MFEKSAEFPQTNNLIALFEKDKAILAQKVDHMQIQLEEAKERESKLKHTYQKMLEMAQNMKDGRSNSNLIFLESWVAGMISSAEKRDRKGDRVMDIQTGRPFQEQEVDISAHQEMNVSNHREGKAVPQGGRKQTEESSKRSISKPSGQDSGRSQTQSYQLKHEYLKKQLESHQNLMISKMKKKTSNKNIDIDSVHESFNKRNNQKLNILKEIENCLSLNEKIMDRVDSVQGETKGKDTRMRSSSKKALKTNSNKRLDSNPNFKEISVDRSDFIKLNGINSGKNSSTKKNSIKKYNFFTGQENDPIVLHLKSPHNNRSKVLNRSSSGVQVSNDLSGAYSNCHYRCHIKADSQQIKKSTSKEKKSRNKSKKDLTDSIPSSDISLVAKYQTIQETDHLQSSTKKIRRKLFHNENNSGGLAEKYTRKYRDHNKIAASKASMNETLIPGDGLSYDFANLPKENPSSNQRLEHNIRHKILYGKSPTNQLKNTSDRQVKVDPRAILKNVTNSIGNKESNSRNRLHTNLEEDITSKSINTMTSGAGVFLDNSRSQMNNFGSVDITKDLISKLLHDKIRKKHMDSSLHHQRNNSSILGKLSANESFGLHRNANVTHIDTSMNQENKVSIPPHLKQHYLKPPPQNTIEVYRSRDKSFTTTNNQNLSFTKGDTSNIDKSINKSQNTVPDARQQVMKRSIPPSSNDSKPSPLPVSHNVLPNININLTSTNADISVIHIDSSNPNQVHIKLERKENEHPSNHTQNRIDTTILKTHLNKVIMKQPVPISKTTMIRPKKHNPQKSRESMLDEQLELNQSESRSEWEQVQMNINKQFQQLEEKYIKQKSATLGK